MNPKVTSWHGKRVWVIGASTGIGAETACLLLAEGARVALSARRRDLLEEVAGRRAEALVLPLDVVEPNSVAEAAQAVREQWQGVDLVLIVAGGYDEMRADGFDLQRAQKLIDLNVGGVLNCLAPVLPMLLAQGSGGVGIVSSVAGYSGLPKALAYGPSKAALINLAESLYLDLRPRGISVYLINPGFVETPLTANNDFPMPALMQATDAARALINGIEQGEFHIHFPKRFTNCLRFARLLPYRAYFWLIHKVTGL